MSDRERLKQAINRMPEYKIAYIANLILGIEKTDIEEVEPDAWDLKMIEEAKINNDGSAVTLEELLEKEGCIIYHWQGYKTDRFWKHRKSAGHAAWYVIMP